MNQDLLKEITKDQIKADMTKFNALNTGRSAHPLEKTVADYVRNHLLPESREA